MDYSNSWLPFNHSLKWLEGTSCITISDRQYLSSFSEILVIHHWKFVAVSVKKPQNESSLFKKKIVKLDGYIIVIDYEREILDHFTANYHLTKYRQKGCQKVLCIGVKYIKVLMYTGYDV